MKKSTRVSLGPDTIKSIDRLAKLLKTSRSKALERLLEALRTRNKPLT